MQAKPRVIVVIGVSGSGKSTVGSRLAHELGWKFLDADDFHEAANVEKMSAGVPLTDADRDGWLSAIASAIDHLLASGQRAVVACSALKRAYRARLDRGAGVAFVLLHADEHLLRSRLTSRRGHFAKADLLDSQLATFEEPAEGEDIESFSADAPPDAIVASIRERLGM